MNAYHLHNAIVLSATFKVNDVPADPTVVTCAVSRPDDSVLDPSPVKDATGVYHADVIVDMAGQWAYVWSGSGAVVASTEYYFIVIPSQV